MTEQERIIWKREYAEKGIKNKRYLMIAAIVLPSAALVISLILSALSAAEQSAADTAENGAFFGMVLVFTWLIVIMGEIVLAVGIRSQSAK